MPRIRKRTATYKRTPDFSLTLDLVNRRQQQELSSQLSKYLLNIMVSS